MFIHSLEIATVLILGLLYLCPDLLPSSEEKEVAEKKCSFAESAWFKKIALFLAKVQGEVRARIHSDSCCICFDRIRNEVRGCCGHIFCGSCLFKFWYAQGQQKLNCPLCRKEMKTIIFDFEKEEGNIIDHETSRVIKNVKAYNDMYSKHPQNIEQVINSIHNVAQKYFNKLVKKEAVVKSAKKALGVLVGVMIIIYIISPSLIMPACNSLVGWLENMLLVVFSVLYATVKYKDSKKNERAVESL